tara:strand:+ start:463 stop:1212 length:750 start_codon:yes stop_codon:yes gene_type:complete
MSYNLTPITAKIKRTTKGGITQPLLNVGGPVKMKASVPAPAKNSRNRQKANESRQKSRHASDLQKAEAIKANKLKKANELSSKEFIYNKRGRKVKNPDYKTPETTTAAVTTKKNKPYVKKGGKATGNLKDYKLNSQARRDEYTARGWKQDDTTKVARKKAEKVNTLTAKPVSIDNKISADPPKVAAKKQTFGNTTVKAPKSKTEVRKTAKINKKLSQAAEARAGGNEKKALRKEKAAMRKAARLAKKNK